MKIRSVKSWWLHVPIPESQQHRSDFGIVDSFDMTFNQPIGEWDVARVNSLKGTFQWALAFNQPLADWDTAGVATLYNTFQTADAFNQPIGGWDVARVYTLYGGRYSNMWGLVPPLSIPTPRTTATIITLRCPPLIVPRATRCEGCHTIPPHNSAPQFSGPG